jgi:hypothetical protein
MKILIGSIVFVIALLLTVSTFVDATVYLKSDDIVKNTKAESTHPAETELTTQSTGIDQVNADALNADQNPTTLDSIKKGDVKKIRTNSLGKNLICKGDVNSDGKIDFRDINWFRMVVEYPWFFEQYNPALFWKVDMNSDDEIDGTDINKFVAVLSGQEKPVCLAAEVAPFTSNVQRRIPLTSSSALKNNWGLKGDINNDGSINGFDIDPFRLVLDYPDFMKKYHPDWFWRADLNSDRRVNQQDVDLFVELLVK